MDVAHLIVDAAAAQHKRDCMENKCTIKLKFFGFAEFAVDVVPLSGRAVIVEFRTLRWMVERKDKESYDEICTFVADIIKKDLEWQMNQEETADLGAQAWHQLTLQRQEQVVARWQFSILDRIHHELKRAMSSLRMMV